MTVLETLNDIRTIRSGTRTATLDNLEEILEKLRAIVAERREEEALYHKKQKERQEKHAGIRKRLIEDCINPKELISDSDAYCPGSESKRPRRKVRQV